MNQNELKKELQMNLPEPPEGFDARSEAKLAKLMIEEEPQMKKKISVGLVFAIVLALLSLTAVAATLSGWNIGSFSRFYGDQDVPEIQAFIKQHYLEMFAKWQELSDSGFYGKPNA